MKTGLRLNEYTKKLLEKRREEPRNKDFIHEIGETVSSPAGATSTEEIRIFNEYMDQVNLRKITEAAPQKKRPLMLKKFFKMKRNQQVEIYSKGKDGLIYTIGKVTAIGRDFVMITNLKDRIWIPYGQIESANTPTGIPNYDNSHQYFIYDNDLKSKLLTNFGEVVSKREVYIQQFFEESLMTNLRSWKGTWVKVETNENMYFGKMGNRENQKVTLTLLKETIEIDLNEVLYISSLRFMALATLLGKKMLNPFSK